MIPNLETVKNIVSNEEQTKQSLVLPILAQVLQWNVFNPLEVRAEFTADAPGKNGEKVDYALDSNQDGHPEILIECKSIDVNLLPKYADQLSRYFQYADSKIGVLTNGLIWQFYTDSEKENIMDSFPFLVFNIESHTSLEKRLFMAISKENFNPDFLIAYANRKFNLSKIKTEIESEIETPSDEFIKIIFNRVNTTERISRPKTEQFKQYIQEAFKEIMDNNASEFIEPENFEIISEDDAEYKPRRRKETSIKDNIGNHVVNKNRKSAWIDYMKLITANDLFFNKLISDSGTKLSPVSITRDVSSTYPEIRDGMTILGALGFETLQKEAAKLSELLTIEVLVEE